MKEQKTKSTAKKWNNANKWRFPTISYVNYKKEFSGTGIENTKCKWFGFKKYWRGRLWYFDIKHHTIILDFRKCLWSDLASN